MSDCAASVYRCIYCEYTTAVEPWVETGSGSVGLRGRPWPGTERLGTAASEADPFSPQVTHMQLSLNHTAKTGILHFIIVIRQSNITLPYVC